ncbi:hypothetical protein [Dactylosporangium sp. NPDC048998]|uniref:hypothetical protein n=1 Tax=Dactylosporangium sp. NPDC048998 TaxID=3363976 RepID=UPI00371CBC0B
MNIQDVVRESLQAQVYQPPAMRDSADRAVRGAQRIRRRRSYLTAGSAAVAVVAIVIGLAALLDGQHRSTPTPGVSAGPTSSTVSVPPSPPATTPTLPRVGVPLLERSTIVLPDGRTISLGGVGGDVLSAYQTMDGFLVNVSNPDGATTSLWLVKPDGTTRRLVERSDEPVAVAGDGRHFAWRFNDRLQIASMNGDATVTAGPSTPAPAQGLPLAIADTAVLLGYSQTGGGLDTFDVWLSAKGAYSASWDKTTHVVAVYGPSPDRKSFLGLVDAGDGSKAACLALLDPANHLRATAKACGVTGRVDDRGPVSPDGRYLALQAESADGAPQVAVVDLERVFQKPEAATVWDAQWPGVWADATTMVTTANNGRLCRFRVGQTTCEQVAAPGVASAPAYQLIPRLAG